MRCSACSGFWVGGALGVLFRDEGRTLLGFSDWLVIPACALVTMIAAPPIAWLQIYTLTALGGGDDAAKTEP
jgi:hypothetical protein